MKSLRKDGIITFLFLGGAKRVQMAHLLAQAAESLGLTAKFVSYELDSRCAIASVGEVVEGLRWHDARLMDDLVRVVEEFEIDIVLPFVDPAVTIATNLSHRCAVFCPGGPVEMQNVLFDKVWSASVFESKGFPIPKTFSGDPKDLKWIAKPRFGSASKGLVILNSEEVARFDDAKGNYLIQEYIENHKEISVDCYVSCRTREISATCPRIRLETMGGEAVRTITIDDVDVIDKSRTILTKLGLVGPVTIQFLRDKNNGRLLLMEINPRLGGGCTASVSAGAKIPLNIIEDALNLPISVSQSVPGVTVCRYLTDYTIFPHEK